MKTLKVDLHVHTGEDPEDIISYSACQLIDRAEEMGFDALALTGHNTVIAGREITRYAERRDILLIPGMEATLSGKHVVVINPEFHSNPRSRSLQELPRLKTDRNLIIAPHPFFPQPRSLKRAFFTYLSCFDAVEYSHFYSRLVDCNRRAVKEARRHGLPLVGTSDCHFLFEFGTTYSMIESAKDMAGIIEAVKAGRIEIRTTPLSSLTMARIAATALGIKLRAMLRSAPRAGPTRAGSSD